MSYRSDGALGVGSKAHRVYLALRDQIDRGVLPVGSVLPGEQRLAAEFTVSRVTVRRALAALAQEGAVVRHVGRGSVVQPQQVREQLSGDIRTLMPQLVEMAERTEVQLLSLAYVEPPAKIATTLDLSEGQRAQVAVRLRRIDGEPYSHLTTYVPERIASRYSESDLATQPLFSLLEQAGTRITSAEQSVGATAASPDVASALQVKPGAALLSLDRTVFDAEGAAVEVLSALYRPDRFRLSMQLSLVGGDGNRHWSPVFTSQDEGQVPGNAT